MNNLKVVVIVLSIIAGTVTMMFSATALFASKGEIDNLKSLFSILHDGQKEIRRELNEIKHLLIENAD